MIAKAFELNTMNVSRLTARMAGIQSLAVLPDEHGLAVVLAGGRHDLPHELQHRVVLRVDLLLVVPEEADGGEDQEAAEHEQHPLEAVEQPDPEEDEREAQDHGPEHAPEEDAELVLAGHREVAHDDRPHEHVVHAEAELDQIAGHVLAGRLASPCAQHHEGERQADRDPDARLDRRRLGGDDVRVAVQDQQVEEQQGGDEGEEGHPHPRFDGDVDEVLVAALRRKRPRSSHGGEHRGWFGLLAGVR